MKLKVQSFQTNRNSTWKPENPIELKSCLFNVPHTEGLLFQRHTLCYRWPTITTTTLTNTGLQSCVLFLYLGEPAGRQMDFWSTGTFRRLNNGPSSEWYSLTGLWATVYLCSGGLDLAQTWANSGVFGLLLAAMLRPACGSDLANRTGPPECHLSKRHVGRMNVSGEVQILATTI